MFDKITYFSSGSKNPLNLFKTIFYKARFVRDNPRYFDPAGIWVFCGSQGSGKTLSAVHCLKQVCKTFPFAMVVSNIPINGLDREIIPFESYDQLLTLSNGTDGIIFFLDELHVLWNSLESKDIPISEMAVFCQMRKNRRVIIGTSQVYGRIAKPIREQLQYVVDCHSLFNIIQINDVIDPREDMEKDGHISGKLLKREVFFHTPEMYSSYDTLEKVNRIDRPKVKKGAK